MRLTWSQLEKLLDEATDRLSRGKLSLPGYIAEWDRLVVFASWTWEEFADEVDRQWTPQKKAASPLFRC